MISYTCEGISNHLTNRGYVKNFDITIVDNDLTLLENLYDDTKYNSSLTYRIIPRYSRIVTDYWTPTYSTEESINYHNSFKNHINDNVMITCNYSNGYFNLIYPINRKEWYAVKPYYSNISAYPSQLTFSRNDLYFHVSSLSDLHSKIYLKEYQNGTSSENSYNKANEFMNKVFPKSHYTAELQNNYNRETLEWIPFDKTKYYDVAEMFDAENKLYYEKITFLANEMTNGDVPLLLQKIANNYESYYMSGNKECLDSTICGTLFPEYTKSVTSNPKFQNGLSSWNKREELAFPATGKIESFPTQNIVKIEYTVNRAKSSENPNSELALYQIEQLNNSSIDDYFLRFDLNDIYGGSEGGYIAYAGLNSSGFAGVYVCYKNSNNEDIGCMAWSDHTNKFDIAWGLVANRIESSSTFNNYRLQNVIRRVRPSAKKFIYTLHLGEYMKKYMPEIYKRKDEIKSMEYGLFATEFRSQQNECYHCEADIKANEISLLKIK